MTRLNPDLIGTSSKSKAQNGVVLTFRHLDFDIWVCSGSGLVPAQEAEINSATTVR